MTMRPEIELLLYCARMQMGIGRDETFGRLLRAPHLTWPQVIDTALKHGMLPLLVHHVRQHDEDAVPSAHMAQLQAHFQAHAGHNLLQTHALLTLLDLFRNHGIPAVPYKGPVLGATIYGNLALRPFCDLDVVVPKRDVQLAKMLLFDQWFRPSELMNAAEEKAYMRRQHACSFVCDADRISVELHWDVAPKHFAVTFDMDALWSRLQTVDLCGKAVQSLSTADLLLMLCIHGAKHRWCRLSWICDVALLVNAHPDLDWSALLQTARQINCERILLLGLRLAADLMAAPLPAEMLQLARANGPVSTLATRISRRLCSATEPRFGLFEHELLYPNMRERKRDRIPYIMHMVRQPVRLGAQDKALLPVPAYLSILHYPLRILRLVGTYGLRPLRVRPNGKAA